MKLGLIFAMMCLVGCAHVETQPAVQPQAQAQPIEKQDSFDKAGDVVASSSRWTYNEGIKAWEWVTSEENKKRAAAAWEASKAAAISAYHEAHKKYEDSQHK